MKTMRVLLRYLASWPRDLLIKNLKFGAQDAPWNSLQLDDSVCLRRSYLARSWLLWPNIDIDMACPPASLRYPYAVYSGFETLHVSHLKKSQFLCIPYPNGPQYIVFNKFAPWIHTYVGTCKLTAAANTAAYQQDTTVVIIRQCCSELWGKKFVKAWRHTRHMVVQKTPLRGIEGMGFEHLGNYEREHTLHAGLQ